MATTRQFRGDAEAISRQQFVPKPEGYVSGVISLKINNKVVSYPSWDVEALVDAWNSAGFVETNPVLASAVIDGTAQYGVYEGILFTARTPGEDFFLEALIDDDYLTNEKQLLTFDPAPAGGTFTLTFDGQTTGAITFVEDDPATTAANILAALNALSNIAPGDVIISAFDNSTTIFLVEFAATYANTDVPKITTNYTNLTGGDVQITVSTSQDGVLPVDEVQTLSLPTTPTGGTFTLTYSGQTTGNIAYNASAATVQTALEALSNIAPGDVVCTGGSLPATPIILTFAATLGDQDIVLLTGDGSLLTGGSANIGSITTVRNGSVGSNFRSRYYFIANGQQPGSATQVRWKALLPDGSYSYSSYFAGNASSATVEAALVGVTIAYPTNQQDVPTEEYVLVDADISAVYCDIDTPGNTGGVVIEWQGQLANRQGLYLLQLETAAGQEGTRAEEQYASPAWEGQSYQVADNTLAGQYTLTVYDTAGDPHTTSPIDYTELDRGVIESKLNVALGGKYVWVSLDNTAGVTTIVISFSNYGYQGTNITILSTSEGVVQFVETTKGSEGIRDTQLITAFGSEVIRDGSFTITYDGQTTASLDHDATAATILAAIEALSNVAVADLQVTGGPIYLQPVILSWKPQLGDVNEVTVTNSLVDSILTVTEYITGGVSIYSREITRNKGPNCFDDATNYDPPGIPTKDDTINLEFSAAAILWGIKQRDTFTVLDAGLNLLQLDTKRPLFQDGQQLYVTSSTTAPAGLTSGNSYFVINMDDRGRFQLSTTLDGTAINITDAGTGTHTIGLFLTNLIVPARFSHDVGLSRVHDSTEEYRPRYLEVYLDKLIIGEREGSSTSLFRLDAGDEPIVNGVLIHNTGSSREGDVGAVSLLINDSTTDVKVNGGSLTLAPFLDESAEVQDIEVHNAELSSVGGTACRDISLYGSTILGNFTPSGSILVS